MKHINKAICRNLFFVNFIYALYMYEKIFKAVPLAFQYVHTALKSKCGQLTLQRIISLMLRSCKIISYTICKFDCLTNTICKFNFTVALLYTNVIMAYVTSTSHRFFQVHLVHFNHACYIILLKNFTIILRNVFVFICRRIKHFLFVRNRIKQND